MFALMERKRKIANTPRMRTVVEQVQSLRGPCVGCKECRGVCDALIDAVVLPDLILRAKAG